MKRIAVFFKRPHAKDYPFTKEEYWNSYMELHSEIEKNGGEFYIVRDNATYMGNGTFSKSWQFKNNTLVETGEIKVDTIYDKGEFISDGHVQVLNNDYVNEVCTNKYKTYQLFKEFCPKTVFVKNEEEFSRALQELQGTIKVIKPVDGEEGCGVFIGSDEYLKNCTYKFPMLVQEFLDTSDGIPGIYEGIHDVRLVFINGEIMYSFYRTPPEGKLLANVAQGGNLVIIPKEKIPDTVLAIAEVVKKNFQNDYCFGVDVGFVRGEPKIIELNSRVALFSSRRGVEFTVFIKKLAHLLTKQ